MTPETTPSRKLLNVPKVGPDHYARKCIRQAMRELRFPTLLELEREAPVASSKAVRKEYPTYELLWDVKLNPGSVAQTHAHALTGYHRCHGEATG